MSGTAQKPAKPLKTSSDTPESLIKQLNEAELILVSKNILLRSVMSLFSKKLTHKLFSQKSTALYQSKQKLNLIKKANKRPVFSEDLIRYAHNISSQHSVASPYDWNVGDPRRPYPTDLQMRQSLLSGNAPSADDASPFHFIPTGLPGADATKKVNIDEKDVEEMSTDSSSSSSSDSQ